MVESYLEPAGGLPFACLITLAVTGIERVPTFPERLSRTTSRTLLADGSTSIVPSQTTPFSLASARTSGDSFPDSSCENLPPGRPVWVVATPANVRSNAASPGSILSELPVSRYRNDKCSLPFRSSLETKATENGNPLYSSG